jgi:thiol-disulfide isomerase/thioredoxin
MHPRFLLRIALSLSFGLLACRAQDVLPEDARAEPSGELIGPVVDQTVQSTQPAQATQATQAAQTPKALPQPGASAPVVESWNTAQIDWQPYEAGLARAKAQKKPICLVLYTGWCPHCRNYSHVFDDPQVVARAKDFVMIRANADEQPAIAAKFVPDGGYVPRTFFLSPDGTLDPEIHAPRPKFLYFFDEREPRSLLAGMDTARHKLVR